MRGKTVRVLRPHFNKFMVGVLTILVAGSAGIAYAMGSGDFSVGASNWAAKNCDSHLFKSNPSANVEQSATCFNYYKINELNAQLSTLQAKLNSQTHAPTSAPVPFVVDSTGTVLGTMSGTNVSTFYNGKLNKIITLSPTGDIQTSYSTVYYANSNCTGQAYVDRGSDAYTTLFKFHDGKYYEVDKTAQPTTITPQSYSYGYMSSPSDLCREGSPSSDPVSVIALTTVDPSTLPFKLPVGLPLNFKSAE